MSELDHLVYAVPDLERAGDEFAAATGVRPAYGGAHPGMGTHNSLVSFGSSYLELIAPDPGQPDPGRPRPFGIDDLGEDERLVTFAVHPVDGESIDGLVAGARAAGYDPGDPIAMSRVRPDGVELRWNLTFPPAAAGDGLIPFVIDWGNTENPARTAPGGVELDAIRWAHPDP
ncbi:MAG: VOC family protein, partial [Acidimicrobiia bacterium]|nr:VOC family protein [Acidimicrobiia bacterium]